jgi:hypothetical protein
VLAGGEVNVPLSNPLDDSVSPAGNELPPAREYVTAESLFASNVLESADNLPHDNNGEVVIQFGFPETCNPGLIKIAVPPSGFTT